MNTEELNLHIHRRETEFAKLLDAMLTVYPGMDVRFSDDPQAFLAELDAYGADLRREIASDAMRRAIGKVGDQFPGAVAHCARLDNA